MNTDSYLSEIFHSGPAIDYNNLVTDAYNEEFGGRHFSIPQINLNSDAVTTINAEIWDTLYTGVVEDILAWWKTEQYEGYEYISYQWAVNDDILSVLIESHPVDWNWIDYYVYNISLSTGTLLSDEEVVSASKISVDEYYEQAKQVLGSSFWSNWKRDSANFYSKDFVDFFNQCLQKTLSTSNVDTAMPFFNDKGQLCIVAPMYSMAGADYYLTVLNMEDFELLPYYAENATLLTHAINISEDDAYKIACDYWNYIPENNTEEVEYEVFLVYDGITEVPDGNHYYTFRLRWWVPENSGTGYQASTIDFLYINAETGECNYKI